MAAMVTTANASLISNRSTSSAVQPVWANSFCMAPTGAVENHAGSCAWVLWPTMRASGVRPCANASLSRISTSAAAPSEMELALAGVTVPSLRKAGFSVGILSRLAFNGCSSTLTTSSPLRPLTVTGAISPAKAPLWMACCARVSDAMAYSSCAARLKPYLSAQASANTPISWPLS